MDSTVILISGNLSVGKIMNAVCEARLCQLVVILKEVLKLFHFHFLLLTWRYSGLHGEQIPCDLHLQVSSFLTAIPTVIGYSPRLERV